MVVVGVAGGGGDLGKAVVEAIARNPKHTVKVLSRNVASGPDTTGASVIKIDYTNIGSMVRILEENQIHTVISTVSLFTEAHGIAQLNLIKACDKSSVTKRFIPSEYGIVYTAEHAKIFPVVNFKLEALALLKKSTLEYTLVSCGIFLDYYGMPLVKSYMKPLTIAIDVENKVAAIPGTGDEVITFTHTFDVAKYMAASVDLEKWSERSIIIGDKMSWNQFLKLAEKTRGAKFRVSYDSFALLQGFQITELPAHRLIYDSVPKEQLQYILSLWGSWGVAGDIDLPYEGSLNSLFPDIKPMTVQEILEQAWKDY